MKPGEAIHWMMDVVSKNGTFILNVPGKPDGTIDADEQAIVDAIGGWLQINGEAIYATRPWKVFGEGAHQSRGGAFGGAGQLDARDIRFTRNKSNDVVYAIVLGWPDGDFVINNLGTASSSQPGGVKNVDCSAVTKNSTGTNPPNLDGKKPAEKPCRFRLRPQGQPGLSVKSRGFPRFALSTYSRFLAWTAFVPPLLPYVAQRKVNYDNNERDQRTTRIRTSMASNRETRGSARARDGTSPARTGGSPKCAKPSATRWTGRPPAQPRPEQIWMPGANREVKV